MSDPGLVTILVVDDDETKRYTVSRTLRKAGFRVEEAASGGEALSRADARPDLVVLDVKLPDVDGFEVCRRLKADARTAPIPVLLISASLIQSEDKVQGLDIGAEGYLTDVVEPLELLATVRSLLRAKRAEEESRLAARQWQSTFDAFSDGVCLLDRSGTLIRHNAAMAGLLRDPGSAAGLTLDEALDAPGPIASRPWAGALETRRRASTELPLGGGVRLVTVDPICDEGAGGVAGLVCIFVDITDRVQLEVELRRRAEELAAADRQKDEFLAMLAHELRNPLAPIRNSLEVMRLDPDPESTRRAREIAARQVGHMARLIDDLLDVSRITSGKIELRSEPIDLGRIARQAVDAITPLMAARRHELTVSIPDGPIPARGDATRLEQVFVNLLTNSAKYTRPGGHVAFSLRRRGGVAEVRVVDDGIGMAAELIPRVFDLFAQAENSLDREQGGLGIGLTLVRSLVQLHGGSISAESAGPGRGSTFVARLPILVAAADDSATPGREVVAEPGPIRILLVDDNVDASESLARVLSLWGCRAQLAPDGPSALEAVAESRPEVVLLDIGLPGMDGYQVARRIRQMSLRPEPRIIALTGYGQEGDRRLTDAAGFDAHLVKPVDLDDLRRLLTGVRPASAKLPGA